jgi:BON domain
MMKRCAGVLSALGLVFTVACSQTDAGITTKVKTAMAADPVVKAYQVDVTTQNKVVTLSGDVETTAAKEQAVRIARQTDGVRDVIDRVRVNDTAATSGLLDDTNRVIDSGVDKTKEAGKDAAAATGRAAKATSDATISAGKKAAKKIKGAVTDKDRDSDRDGH